MDEIPERLKHTEPHPDDSEVVAASKMFQRRKDSVGVGPQGGIVGPEVAARLYVGMDLPVEDLLELRNLITHTSPLGSTLGLMTATGYIEGIGVGLLIAEKRKERDAT